MTPKQFCFGMSSVATEPMFSVETGQTSSAETRQMSTGKTGRCPVSLFYIRLVASEDICLVSTADICPVSTADICPVSTEDIFPVSTSHCLCVRNRPRAQHMESDGSRQPYSNFSNRPHPPRQNRGAVLMGIAVWRVAEKPKKIKCQWGQYVR